MTLQEEIMFDQYFRCYAIGRKHVHVMRYDPKRPHHERYVKDGGPIDPALYERVHGDSLKLMNALGYDFCTLEFAVRDGIPYAIDFLNPAPDAALESVGPENFAWVVETAAKWLIERAHEDSTPTTDYRWQTYLAAGETPAEPPARKATPSRPRKPAAPRGSSVSRPRGEAWSVRGSSGVHPRRRGGVPDPGSGDAGAALPRPGDPRRGQARPEGTGQARDAPVGHRDRHGHLQRHLRGPQGRRRDADRDHPPRAQERHARGVRGNAPVLQLGRPEDLSGSALRPGRPGDAAAGAGEPDLRSPRACRDQGPRARVPDHERVAVLPAAHAGALDELAVLAGPQHRPEELPHEGLRPVPAHGHARILRHSRRVRRLRQDPRRHQLDRQRQEDLVGRASASLLRDDRVPRLRRP